MPFSLTYNDLPMEVEHWPALPLSLSGDEVMPLDYRAGHTGWLLYGRNLNKTLLSEFQRRLLIPLVVVASWCVDDYQVIRLAGLLPKRAKKIAEELELDIAQLEFPLPQLAQPGLLVMDMDSTSIQIECIDEIAKLAGVGEQVSAITERAMQGELDFATSLRRRVATLKGCDAQILKQVLDGMPLMPGLELLVSRLQKLGWYVAIVSGGFTYFANELRDRLNLIDVFANQLEIKNGKLTGKVIGSIVDAEYKAHTLITLAEKLAIPSSQTVAVGDGANDLKMLQAAGVGIAYHAKPKVFAKAKQGIRYADLMGIYCILSVSLQNDQ